MPKLSYTEAIAEALVQKMDEDQNVFLMGEGVDGITGIYGTILPAYRKFGESRVMDTPICENGLTGIATGSAMDGLRPVLFHQRNDFMLLAMDQMVNHAAKIRFMTNGKKRVPLTIVSFVARKVGEGSQHTQSLQAVFGHFPGLKIVMPTTPFNAKGLLISAIEDDDPVIVLYHRALFDEDKAEVLESLYRVPIGKSRMVKSGTDITIVAVSAAVKDAVIVAGQLKDHISVEVIDLLSIRPLDRELIVSSVMKTGRLLVVDTGWKSYGVSAEIIASITEKSIGIFKTEPRRICMAEVPAPATPFLLTNYHPNTAQIIKVVEEMMG